MTSNVALNLTAEGVVVPAGHPDSASILVAEGGFLPDDIAAKYGLRWSMYDQEACKIKTQPGTDQVRIPNTESKSGISIRRGSK